MTLFDELIPTADSFTKAIYDRMVGGIGEGWSAMFKGEGEKILMNICHQLGKRGVVDKEVICPTSTDVLRAFRECKYSNLKIVFILQDPYHQVINGQKIADGIAMSCSYTHVLQPSLRLVYDEIERTVGHVNRNPDLKCWANQGVLMLNTALTVKHASPGSHVEIWRPFTQYLLKELSNKTSQTIYVFCGANAKSFSHLVTRGVKYYTVHPAAAAYRGGMWDSEDLFNNINYVLKNRGLEQIKW